MNPDYAASMKFLRRWAPDFLRVVTAITPSKESITTRTFAPPEDKALLAFLKQMGAERNVYFSVNPVRRVVVKKPEREDVKSMDWLHVDVDPRAGEDLDEERARILALLTTTLPSGVPPPTVVVDSGGGYQGFWKLREPFPIDGVPEAYEEAKRYNQQLEHLFGADPCHNVDRIMRVPGTVNRPDAVKRKKGRVEALAQLVEWDEDRAYDLSEFSPATESPGTSGGTSPLVRISDSLQPVALDDLPDDVRQACRIVIVQGRLPDDPTKWESRSEALFWVCCELVRAGCSDDTIYSIITNPAHGISDSVLNKGSRVEKYAIRQIERAREEAISPELRELNEAHAVVESIGGKCRVISEEPDPVLNRTRICTQSFADFKNRYMNRSVDIMVTDAKGNSIPKAIPLGDWWLKHPQRQQYRTIVFSPGHDVRGCYNLWTGFGVEARPGDCSLFLDHVRDNLCRGCTHLYDYVLGWMARAVQYPAEQGHVAIVMRGRRGVGKGKFATNFGRLFGRHFVPVTNPDHLTGKFNSHLRDCVVLFGDEAFVANDKTHESVLKGLVTEDTIMSEAKGYDADQAANYMHVILASNAQWVVPAGEDERRFLVLDVGEDQHQDTTYFGALQRQLEAGGFEALLHMLMNYDLSEFDVRAVPQTAALRDQKVQSYSAEQEWWYTKLRNGEVFEGEEWPSYVFATHLVHDFTSYISAWRASSRSNATRLGQFMTRALPTKHRLKAQLAGKYDVVRENGEVKPVNRPRVYLLPTLEVCRDHWDKAHGGPFEWPEPHVVEDGLAKDPF